MNAFESDNDTYQIWKKINFVFELYWNELRINFLEIFVFL